VSTNSQRASAVPSGQFDVRHFLGMRSSFLGPRRVVGLPGVPTTAV
jgi:hypothetical protein